MMQPYLYYPEIDKLIWLKDPTYGPPRTEDNGFSTVHGVLYATQSQKHDRFKCQRIPK